MIVNGFGLIWEFYLFFFWNFICFFLGLGAVFLEISSGLVQGC